MKSTTIFLFIITGLIVFALIQAHQIRINKAKYEISTANVVELQAMNKRSMELAIELNRQASIKDSLYITTFIKAQNENTKTIKRASVNDIRRILNSADTTRYRLHH